MLKATIPWLVIALLASGCVSRGPGAKAPDDKISFIVTSHRYLETEPCGCGLTPIGGVERERNAVRKWRRERAWPVTHVTVGTTFVPLPAEYEPTLLFQYRAKAKMMAEALRGLETTALSPGAEDLVLGLEFLGDLEKRSEIPFISSNMIHRGTEKPIFRPFHIIELGAARVALVGITSEKVGPRIMLPPEVGIKNAGMALRETLSHPQVASADLVVLLSSLTYPELDAVRADIARIPIILGGGPDDWTVGAEQLSPRLIQMNPEQRGRAVAILDLPGTSIPPAGLFNPLSAELNAQFRQSAMDTLQSKAKRIFASDRAAATQRLKRYQAVPESNTAGALAFRFEGARLNNAWETAR